MLSTLMVYDGIKALSGAHRRCFEPRPWVALHSWRAVISVPCCQQSSPFLPKTPSLCSISRGRVGAMHFSAAVTRVPLLLTLQFKSMSQKHFFFFFYRGLHPYAMKRTPFRHCTRAKGQSWCSLSVYYKSQMSRHRWPITGYSFYTWKSTKKK